MAIKSAGVLIYRRNPDLQVLLGHMGGPFWENKDAGAWGIPKGLVEENETLKEAALRECAEEVGFVAKLENLRDLGSIKMKSGKEVYVWAHGVAASLEITISSNCFEIEWPKGSGQMKSFPEIDRVEWFDINAASEKIIAGQIVFLDRLLALAKGETQ